MFDTIYIVLALVLMTGWLALQGLRIYMSGLRWIWAQFPKHESAHFISSFWALIALGLIGLHIWSVYGIAWRFLQ